MKDTLRAPMVGYHSGSKLVQVVCRERVNEALN